MRNQLFQHTAARRRLAVTGRYGETGTMFQHTAARRRLVVRPNRAVWGIRFQHTAARRRLAEQNASAISQLAVSTHSRPKAAGTKRGIWHIRQFRFNTQPPEGGWVFHYRC